MTELKAKELSLEVWEYLAEHPEAASKFDLPTEIAAKVDGMLNRCPLCKLFHGNDCVGCPLEEAGEGCMSNKQDTAYSLWTSGVEEKRRIGAKRIVEIVKAWSPETKIKSFMVGLCFSGYVWRDVEAEDEDSAYEKAERLFFDESLASRQSLVVIDDWDRHKAADTIGVIDE
jgi:hypothetical protein